MTTRRSSSLSRFNNSKARWFPSLAAGLATTALLAGTIASRGQESQRQSVLSRIDRKPDGESAPRNFNFETGRLRWRLRGSLETEFNDNVNVSKTDPQKDLILRPTVSADAYLPITERNGLDFGIGIGYQKFITHGDYDQLYIAPKSHLSFGASVGRVQLTLYDEFSYVQDPTREGSISGSAQYGGFENSAGLAADWAVNEHFTMSAGFDYFTFLSSDEMFSALDRSTKSIPLRFSYRFNERITAGTETYAARTDYEDLFLPSLWQVSVGLYGDWRLGEHVVLRPEAGISKFFFDEQTSLVTCSETCVSTMTSFYGGLTLDHVLNERWRYSLSGGREALPGLNAALQELFYTRLKVTWRVGERIIFRPTFFWEDAQDSAGPLSENYWRVGAEPRVEFLGFKNWSFAISYRFILKRSERVLRDYEQSRLLLSLAYTF
jgi:hypothetical protein